MNDRDNLQEGLLPDSEVPYTARLNAYYRAEENKDDNPLFRDPFAERLAGDMSHVSLFLKERSGIQIARHHYIDTEIITPWCKKHEESQIVILGAGLDTRAYRLNVLKHHHHIIFEIDLPIIIEYKQKVLANETPVCSLVQIAADLSNPTWPTSLRDHGFSSEMSTLWILEGLVYYIEKDDVVTLLRKATELVTVESELFADVCVPALASLVFGPYSSHFKWGVEKQHVGSLFAAAGWDVTSSYADDFDYGRDVGQKGIIYVCGRRAPEKILEATKDTSSSIVEFPYDIQTFSTEFIREILPAIERIILEFNTSTIEGAESFVSFVRLVRPTVELLAETQETPLNIGHISPRLLGDPLSIEEKVSSLTPEEIESHIVGYLKAILYLSYCSLLGLIGQQFHETELYREGEKISSIDTLSILIQIVRNEIDKLDS